MKLLITGSSGFLGSYTVAEALRCGHQVRAVVRQGTDAGNIAWASHPDVELVRVDLRSRTGLVDALRGVDAVLHLAAAKAGSFYAQFAGTVLATENLLDAMVQANVKRIVAISTFSVYDYLHLRTNRRLDEQSPLECKAELRDEYARTKLLQEQLVRDFEKVHQGQVTILRPGVIYGRDNLWNARLGAQVSDRLWIRIGGRAHLPMNYVENCAQAILLAVQRPQAIGQTINLVDDNPPTQNEYARKLMDALRQSPRIIPINWTMMRMLARCASMTNTLLFRGQARLPGILVPCRLHARCKPLRFRNDKAKEVLGWQPRFDPDTAMRRSAGDIPLPDWPRSRMTHAENLQPIALEEPRSCA